MSFVQTLGSATKASSTLTTTLTLTVNTTVGNTVIVPWEGAASATGLSLSCADSRGNTYTLLASQTSSSGVYSAVFSCQVAAGKQLVSGDTITVTQGGTATANGEIWAEEHSGLGSPIVSNGNTVASGATSVSSGNVTMASAGTLVVVLHTSTGSSTTTSATLGGSWNARETGTTGSTTKHWGGVWDQAVAAGTYSAAPTLSQTAVSVGYAITLVGFTATSAPVASGSITLTGSAAAAGTAPAAGSVTLTGSTTSPTGAAASAAGLLSLSGASAGGIASVIHSWLGASSPSGFRVRCRTSGATSIRLAVSTSPAMTSPTYFGPQAPSAGYVDFTATGLTAGTQYYYQLTDNPAVEVPLGTVGKAKTLPAPGTASFKFAFGGCTNGYNANREAVDDIRSWGADFFLHLGDFHYKSLVSTDPTVHRQGWEDQIRFAPGLFELTRDVPWWYCRSDHEAGPDNGDSNNAYTAASIAGYQQVVPYGALGDTGATPAGLYQSWVVGRVRFILIDIRNTDRSPGANTDNSSKTMLGATQKAWLKARLLDPEPVKVIVSDVAWMGPPDTVAKPDAWWSYATERTEIASFIAANSVQVVFLHSDTHSVACASPAKNIYGGFPVYCSAPLANTGGGRDLSTFDAFYFTNPTTTDSRQYGRVTVTDTGTQITFAFSGWDAVTGTQQVGRTDTFVTSSAVGSITLTGGAQAAAAAAAAGSITLTGSASVPASAAAAGSISLSGASTPAGFSTQGVMRRAKVTGATMRRAT